MAEEEEDELTSFHGPTKLTATCVQLTLEKKQTNPNWQNRTSTVNHREATCKRVRGAETRLGTTPMVRLTTDRRESTSYEKGEVQTHPRHPRHWGPMLGRQIPITFSLKTREA